MRMQLALTLLTEQQKRRKASFRRLALRAGLIVYQAVILSQAGIVLAQSNGLAPNRAPSASPSISKASDRPLGHLPDVATRARVGGAYGQLPLSFEPNRGQADARVQFLSRAPGFTLFLTGNNEAVLKLRRQSAVSSQQPADRNSKFETRNSKLENRSPNSDSRLPAVLRMSLVGGNRAAEIAGADELPGKSNYFIGRDPEKWHAGIPNYRKVAARGVYPGIDLVYYGNQRQLEYDFTVAPGADPGAIRLGLEIADGKTETGNSKLETRSTTESVRIDAKGDLVIALDGGDLRFHKPVVYQEQSAGSSSQLSAVSGQQTVSASPGSSNHNSQITYHNSVEGRFVLLAKNLVGFEIGPYDRTRPLVIDPVLSYSTYLGGSNIDSANSIAVSSDGSAFIAGETDSTDFPTAHALQPNVGGPLDFPNDAFVSKISPDGSTLLYSTFLGGARQERANGIAVDTFGNAYVTGTTISEDYPASIGAADPNCGNDGHCDSTTNNGLLKSDGFVTKLNPEGSAIAYSTFISHLGPQISAGPPPVFSGANDRSFAIAVDLNGNAYVTGVTDYADDTGPFFGGPGDDVFLIKINANGTGFSFFGDFGGAADDEGFSVAADNASFAFVTGVTYSNPFLGNASAGDADGFVMKIDTTQPVATSIAYSTLLGGAGRDQANGIAIDAGGNAYITGVTNSANFPTTAGVVKTPCTSEGDAFVSKLSPVAALIYSTCVGGTGADYGAGIALDTATNAYITGFTNSTNFPTSGVPFQGTYGGGNTDAFVFKLDPTGTTLVYSSYLGGSNAEEGKGIAVDANANAYVGGQTCSTDFPPARPLQSSPGGNCDAFVAKVRVGPDINLSATSLSFGSQAVGTTSLPQTVIVTSIGDSALNITGVAITGNFAIQSNTCSGASLTVDQTCTVSVTFSPTSFGPKTGTLTLTDNVAPGTHAVSLTGSGTNLSIAPTALIFGDQGLNTTSPAQTVTMTNTGTGAVTIIGIDAAGDFAQTNTCGNSLAAGANCTISVTFTPTAVGILSGTVTITDTDPTSPQIITLTGHGTAAVAAVTPATLSFGNQGGTGPSQNVTLSNTGNAPLAISGISITGPFSQTSTCGSTLVSGASCTISVSFLPTSPGAATGTLSIADSASGSPQTVSLSGTGVVPVVSLAPTSLTFASQAVTTPPTASDPQTVVLTNTGNATLNIAVNGILISGVNASDFLQTNTCGVSAVTGGTILAGASCAISVSFKPTAAGTRLASVTIIDDASNSPQSIAVTGTGANAPWAVVSPTSLSFVDTPVGVTTSTTTGANNVITLTNQGNADLLISSIATTGDFAKSDDCGSSRTAGQSCTISVTFKPTAVGNRYGTLTINDNSSNSPQTVLLAGNGQAVPTVSLAPTAITFGDQIVNTTSATQTVTLTNVGGADLAITNVAIAGTNGGDFAIVGNTCAGTFVPGSAPCTITVSFTPTAAGVRTGSIVVADNAPTAGSQQTVPLSGNGTLPPGVGLNPTSLTFAERAIGTTSDPQSVILTNTGGGTLNISGITKTGTDAADFNVNHNCPGSLAPGLTCTISVTFTPSATGNRLAAVSIADNAPGSPQSIPLFGGGSSVAGDYTISIDPKTATIFAGSTANFSLTVTPLNGFTGKVNVSCTAAIRQGACVVNPTSVTLDGTNPLEVGISVQTTARVQAPPGSGPNSLPPAKGYRWVPWAFLLMVLVTLGANRRRRTAIALSVVILMALLWTACGGGGEVGVPNGTPAGSYTLTITGVSGTTTKTTAVTLIVN
ncbi:MAG: choice-of-anchor D domain-containing protein [Terriglobia bacterium]